jgi:hypothetical protein
MPLNFTGGTQPAPSPAGRTRAVVLACFGAAALVAGLVFATALRQHRTEAPNLAPPLVGTDRVLAAAAPPPPSPPPAEPWIMHPAATPAAPAQAAPAPATPVQGAPQPAGPHALSPAVAKARMLAALRQVPHGTVTLSVENDAGAQAYARKLADLFREAGWRVDQISAFGPGPPRWGLAAAFGISPSDEAVREAFDAIGFQFAPPPSDAGVIRSPEIFVGAP